MSSNANINDSSYINDDLITNTIDELDFDKLLQNPFNMTICGGRNSGKSQTIKNIIFKLGQIAEINQYYIIVFSYDSYDFRSKNYEFFTCHEYTTY